MKALCEECLRSFDLLDDHDAAEYAYGHDCEREDRMTTTELKTTEDHIRAGHQVRAYWTIEQAADTRLADDGRLIVGSVYDTVADSESETGFWCVTCEAETEPGPETEINYA